MNKERVLQLVSDAIDNGAHIDIGFFNSYDYTKEDAETLIKPFGEALGLDVEEMQGDACKWLRVGTAAQKYHVSVHYSKEGEYLVDDLDYEEGEESA